ncbi:hypothetical protein GEMRC1_011451 [Eukaryota sp. GEM-RC1]
MTTTVDHRMSLFTRFRIEGLFRYFSKFEGDHFDFSYPINQKKYETICDPQFSQFSDFCSKFYKELKKEVGQSATTKVVLFGGFSYISKIRSILKSVFEVDVLESTVKTKEDMSLGACLYRCESDAFPKFQISRLDDRREMLTAMSDDFVLSPSTKSKFASSFEFLQNLNYEFSQKNLLLNTASDWSMNLIEDSLEEGENLVDVSPWFFFLNSLKSVIEGLFDTSYVDIKAKLPKIEELTSFIGSKCREILESIENNDADSPLIKYFASIIAGDSKSDLLSQDSDSTDNKFYLLQHQFLECSTVKGFSSLATRYSDYVELFKDDEFLKFYCSYRQVICLTRCNKGGRASQIFYDLLVSAAKNPLFSATLSNLNIGQYQLLPDNYSVIQTQFNDGHFTEALFALNSLSTFFKSLPPITLLKAQCVWCLTGDYYKSNSIVNRLFSGKVPKDISVFMVRIFEINELREKVFLLNDDDLNLTKVYCTKIFDLSSAILWNSFMCSFARVSSINWSLKHETQLTFQDFQHFLQKVNDIPSYLPINKDPLQQTLKVLCTDASSPPSLDLSYVIDFVSTSVRGSLQQKKALSHLVSQVRSGIYVSLNDIEKLKSNDFFIYVFVLLANYMNHHCKESKELLFSVLSPNFSLQIESFDSLFKVSSASFRRFEEKVERAIAKNYLEIV